MKSAGIDISHKTVTLAINRAGRIGKPHDFKNTAQGHLALIRAVRRAQVSRVCLEVSGLYHLDLALALDDAGLDLMVINPKAAKRYNLDTCKGEHPQGVPLQKIFASFAPLRFK